MSSYLSFYLVPKKSKKRYDFSKDDGSSEIEIELSTGTPLLLTSYSRSDEIYQAYSETLNPAYCGMEEKYTELTYEDSQKVIREYEREVKETEERLDADYKMLKEGGYNSELWEDIQTMEKYVKEQKQILEELKYISDIVYEVYEGYGDFEKVLINVD